jgi:hypothetical protein
LATVFGLAMGAGRVTEAGSALTGIAGPTVGAGRPAGGVLLGLRTAGAFTTGA